jgi:GH15 family glucan-1,4-alpha-glucosidase
MADPERGDEGAQSGARTAYPPIRDLAAIGDGRTVALVTSGGSIVWLPFPFVDSPTIFASLLDDRRGGAFHLAPVEPYAVERRYVPDTNVLETTFTTAGGVACVVDAMTLPLEPGLIPFGELVRRVEAVSGGVGFAWSVEPRFGYGMARTTMSRRDGIAVATAANDALAVSAWDAGDVDVTDGAARGSFTARRGSAQTIALSMAHQEPLIFPSRGDVECRLDATITYWQRWTAGRTVAGPYRDAIVRSALALKLLVNAPTGAVAAAPTTSLPEEIGGERNWDYRFSWVRDSAFVMEALLSLGCHEEAEAFFWWLMHASQISHPHLQVLYRLDGGTRARERTLPLDGYQASRPVRIGNKAIEQLQLDIYGDLLQTAWVYAHGGHTIDREIGDRLAEIADLVTRIWRDPDAGIWEVRGQPERFTQSRMLCWVALDRAIRLAEDGHVPARHMHRWRAIANDIAVFIEERCWSDAKQSYTRSADTDDLDASVLLGPRLGYADANGTRIARTIDAVRRELGHGPFLYRYVTEDGLRGGEGFFLCCSFWLVEVLAMAGRTDEATALMDELLAFGNDVGLFAEEIDPALKGFLGNFPQGLTHLALITAAATLEEARAR